MTGAAFLASVVGMLYAWATDDRPGLLILSFWVFLVAFAMAMSRDAARNEAVREREAFLRLQNECAGPYRGLIQTSAFGYARTGDGADWIPLDEAWPTAAPGTFPEEEEIW